MLVNTGPVCIFSYFPPEQCDQDPQSPVSEGEHHSTGLAQHALVLGCAKRDKRHLLILVAITQLSKELQFCNFTMW